MKKIDWNKPTHVGFVAAATIVVLAIAIYLGRYFCLSKSDWASWVQAVGSIAAIAVSLAISRHAIADQRAKERNFPLMNLRVIAERAERMINAAPNTLTEHMDMRVSQFLRDVNPRSYRDVARALDEFPMFTLQDDHAVTAVLDMRLAMLDYCDLVKQIPSEAGIETRKDAVTKRLYPFEECQERFNTAMAQLQTALDGAGLS